MRLINGNDLKDQTYKTVLKLIDQSLQRNTKLVVLSHILWNTGQIMPIELISHKLTQRQIAKELGMSLGKTNYLIQALLKRGLVKVNNFRTSDNKLGYLYLLTPEGIEAKRKLTMIFLQRKSEEFDKLKEEMERINKI